MFITQLCSVQVNKKLLHSFKHIVHSSLTFIFIIMHHVSGDEQMKSFTEQKVSSLGSQQSFQKYLIHSSLQSVYKSHHLGFPLKNT